MRKTEKNTERQLSELKKYESILENMKDTQDLW